MNSTIRMRAVGTVLLAVALSGCGNDETPDVIGGPFGTPDVVQSENQPPTLLKIGAKIAVVGVPLVIEPRGIDPEGDFLRYSAYGVPDGAVWSESPPRFTWTPDAFVKPVSITFLVSDGVLSDRERVEISVTTEAGNHVPAFQPVSDQVIEVGESYVLQLQATDADGDVLTFGTSSELPDGASLSGPLGIFSWTPPPGLEGSSFSLTFTADDGEAVAETTVRFFVLAPGQNRPPTFLALPPQIAPAGDAYSLVVQAVDPDGDRLEYSVQSGLPDGALFTPDTATLEWIPTTEQVGSHSVVFAVTDETYQTLLEVEIEVPANEPGVCKDDVNEPNNSVAEATTITTGSYEKLSLCDTATNPVDTDYFQISLIAGQELSVEVFFSHDEGDIDLEVFALSDPATVLARADSVTDNEFLGVTVPHTGAYVIKAFGVGQAILETSYTMTVSTTGGSCTDDLNEPNDDSVSATPLLTSAQVSDAQICPNDPDIYVFDVVCGSDTAVTVTFDGDVSLDLDLFRASNLSTPTTSVVGDSGSLTAFYEDSPVDQKLFVRVQGDPPESTKTKYALSAQVTGSANCTDDSMEPNDQKSDAVLLNPPQAEIANAASCCSEDWFFVPLELSEGVTITLTTASEGMTARLLDSDGVTQVAGAVATETGLTVTLGQAPFSGNYYLVVEGPPGGSYSLSMLVLTNDGCTSSKACGDATVCHLTSGQCVSDQCTTAEDCPAGQEMPCVDLRCRPGCTYDADCKLAQACKGFSIGRYCGDSGAKSTGDSCFTSDACAGSASCAFPEKNGYCTNFGCQSNATCPDDTSCVQFQTTTLCGVECSSNSDCRLDEGFTCQPRTLPNGIPVNVCLPVP